MRNIKLTINPKDVNAIIGKGIDLIGLVTILYYDRALSLDPNNILALNNKGLALGRLGIYTGAIKYYDKALAIGQQDKLIDLLIALSTIFMWTRIYIN